MLYLNKFKVVFKNCIEVSIKKIIYIVNAFINMIINCLNMNICKLRKNKYKAFISE